jgi:hypothetical protein
MIAVAVAVLAGVTEAKAPVAIAPPVIVHYSNTYY